MSFQEYLAAEEIRNQRRYDILVDNYGVAWWQEVTRLLVGLHNPPAFSDLMRAVVAADKLRGHESFTAACIGDARELSALPFVEAAERAPRWAAFVGRLRGRDPSVGRYAALHALRSMPKHTIEPVVARLAEIARRESSLRSLISGILSAEGSPATAAAPVDRETGLPSERINLADGMELVLIPAGPFQAGSRDEPDNPERQERIARPYYMARYPVTNAQYRKFVEAGGPRPPLFDDERFGQDQQPVTGVSWHDAKSYCEWAGLRLPTEWEWEKAARGTDGRRFPWGNEEPTPELANFGDVDGQPTPVGSYPKGASPFGLLDMAGNVWELRSLPPLRDPCGGRFGWGGI
jgi:formylglycine-generating enzyme required for sulfatase activity